MCAVRVLSWAGSGQWPQVDGEKPPVGSSVCSRTCSMLWTGERQEGKAEEGRAAGQGPWVQQPLVLVGLEAPSQGRETFPGGERGILKHFHCSIPS